MPLEKTFLKVDVLTLEVRVAEATARRLERLVAGRRYGEPLADSVARILHSASDAIDITQTFLRNVPLDRFLDEVRARMEKAVRSRGPARVLPCSGPR